MADLVKENLPDDVIRQLRVDLMRRQAVIDRDRKELQEACRHTIHSRHVVATCEFYYYVDCWCSTCDKAWWENSSS